MVDIIVGLCIGSDFVLLAFEAFSSFICFFLLSEGFFLEDLPAFFLDSFALAAAFAGLCKSFPSWAMFLAGQITKGIS